MLQNIVQVLLILLLLLQILVLVHLLYSQWKRDKESKAFYASLDEMVTELLEDLKKKAEELEAEQQIATDADKENEKS